MSFKEFLKNIRKLQEDYNLLDRFAELGLFINLKVIDAFINLIAEKLGDKEGWLDWWIYENDFGRSGLEVSDKDGNIILTTTPRDIYDLIKG